MWNIIRCMLPSFIYHQRNTRIWWVKENQSQSLYQQFPGPLHQGLLCLYPHVRMDLIPGMTYRVGICRHVHTSITFLYVSLIMGRGKNKYLKHMPYANVGTKLPNFVAYRPWNTAVNVNRPSIVSSTGLSCRSHLHQTFTNPVNCSPDCHLHLWCWIQYTDMKATATVHNQDQRKIAILCQI